MTMVVDLLATACCAMNGAWVDVKVDRTLEPINAVTATAIPQLRNWTETPLFAIGSVPGEPADLEIGPEAHLGAGVGYIQVWNVSLPTITPMLARDNPTGATVLVAPGGGYDCLEWEREGAESAFWLNSIGVHAMLLKYRVPGRAGQPVGGAPLMDAQRAMSLVRANAVALGVNVSQIGIMGFSAAGHLAAFLTVSSSADSASATRRAYPRVDAADDLSCRPDFTVMLYPWWLVDTTSYGNDLTHVTLNVTSRHPPSFIAMAEDDPVHVENAIYYYAALARANVSSDLQVYATGGHGFGVCKHRARHMPGVANEPACGWTDRFEVFLRARILRGA